MSDFEITKDGDPVTLTYNKSTLVEAASLVVNNGPGLLFVTLDDGSTVAVPPSTDMMGVVRAIRHGPGRVSYEVKPAPEDWQRPRAGWDYR